MWVQAYRLAGLCLYSCTLSTKIFVCHAHYLPRFLFVWLLLTALLTLQVADLLKAEGQCSTEYVEYERCGHVPMDERPAEFLHDLQRFVTDVSSERQPTPDADSLTDGVDDAPLPLYPPSKTAPVDG